MVVARQDIMRATPKRFVKSLFLCSVMGFLVINLNLFLKADMNDHGVDLGVLQDSGGPGPGGGAGLPGSLGADSAVNPSDLQRPLLPAANGPSNETFPKFIANDNNVVNNNKPVDNHTSGLLVKKEDGYHEQQGGQNSSVMSNRFSAKDFFDYKPIGTDPTVIKAYISAMNREQPIRNLDKFDLSTSDNTIVIVVQVGILCFPW